MGSSSSKHSFLDCSNDYELVIKSSKELEYILDTNFEAHGKGLHEKISTARGLPNQLVKDMRFLATVRNKLIHERGFDKIEDRAGFIKAFTRSALALEEMTKSNNKKDSSCILM
jgi:hypothetical protein